MNSASPENGPSNRLLDTLVRVLPICVESDPTPAQSLKVIRVLLVGAEPIDEPGVGRSDVDKD